MTPEEIAADTAITQDAIERFYLTTGRPIIVTPGIADLMRDRGIDMTHVDISEYFA